MIILNKYRVTNIKRFRTFMFLSVLTICIILFLILSSFSRAYSKSIVKFEYVYVEEGDTIWSIASNYDDNIRIDELVYKIEKINNIKNSTIYPGDLLAVPQY